MTRTPRLAVQLIGYSIGALAIAWGIISFYLVTDERSSLERDLRSEGERLSAATAELCVEHLLVRDYPVLEAQLTTTVRRVTDVAWARVMLPDGRIVAETTRAVEPEAPVEGELISFRRDIVVAGISVPIGEIELGLSTASLEERLARRRLQLGTGALVTFSLLALLLALLIHRWVATPLSHLHGQADALAAGDLDSEILLDARNELGDLAGTLETMRRGLKASRSEIQQQNEELRAARDDLERRVEERSSELANAQHSLARAERLAAVGQLAAGVGHEINNPLTFLTLNIEHVLAQLHDQRDQPGAERMHGAIRNLRIAMDATERIAKIVRDLRVHARPAEEGKPERVDVEEAITTAVSLTSSEVRYRAQLHVDCGALPPAAAEEGKLVQVLVNLIVNAARSIPAGSVGENRIDIRGRAVRGMVEIQLFDTGSGVPEEIRDRVFEPFFTTCQQGEGTGLGLSICHAVVTSLGGEISLAPREEGGSIATVRLPIATDCDVEAPKGTSEARQTDIEPADGGRILVIDDEPQIRRMMQLTFDNFDVAVASSGREALEILDRSQDFDAILCDLMMADITGVELYPQVCARWPGLKDAFIFMTGGAFTEPARTFVENVPAVCLEKPFRSAVVLTAIEAVKRARRG